MTIQVQKFTGPGAVSGRFPAASWSAVFLPMTPVRQALAVSLIYRGDPDGTPDPDPTGSTKTGAGTYLWQYTVPSRQHFYDHQRRAGQLRQSNGVLQKRVHIVRTPCSLSVPPMPACRSRTRPEAKIISGYYSPVNGTETNEAGDSTAAAAASSRASASTCAIIRPTPRREYERFPEQQQPVPASLGTHLPRFATTPPA